MKLEVGGRMFRRGETIRLWGLAKSFQIIPLWANDGEHFVVINPEGRKDAYKVIRSEWVCSKPLPEVFDTCAESLKALKDVARLSKDEIGGIMEAFQEIYSLCSFLCFLQGTRVINDKTGEVYDRVFVGGDAIEELFFVEEQEGAL